MLPLPLLPPARLNMQFIAQHDDGDYDETTFTLVLLQSSEMRSSPKEIGAFNENGRNFVATKDTSRDFSNSQDNTDRGSMSDQAFACSASSVESLPSASGSSKYKALDNYLGMWECMCLRWSVCVCLQFRVLILLLHLLFISLEAFASALAVCL